MQLHLHSCGLADLLFWVLPIWKFLNQEWNQMTGIRAKTTDDWFFEKDKEALFKIASLASLESGHWTIDLEQA